MFPGPRSPGVKSVERKRKTPSSSPKSPGRLSRSPLSVVNESFCNRRAEASCEFSYDSLKPPNPFSAPSQRRRVFQELHETEKNYLGILHGILEIIDKVVSSNQGGGQIITSSPALDQMQELAFSIEKIRSVHKQVFEKLDGFSNLWNENCLIGQIFVSHAKDFESVYPWFINDFSRYIGVIEDCEAKSMRFQALMKLCEKQKEYGREHLKGLLIRPIQRLGSILLLLRELLKQSRKTGIRDDVIQLEFAVNELDRVLTTVNEKKRVAEANELLNSINWNMAEDVFSGHSTYVDHLECQEMDSKQFCDRGTQVLLIVMSGRMEVAKVRSRPSPESRYKHVASVPFSRVQHVVDIQNAADGLKGAFALEGELSSLHDKLIFKFETEADSSRKKAFLGILAERISISTCVPSDDILKKVAFLEGCKPAGRHPWINSRLGFDTLDRMWFKSCSVVSTTSKKTDERQETSPTANNSADKKKPFTQAVEERLLLNGDSTGEDEMDQMGESRSVDSFNERALEKARKLASQASLRVSKVFSSFAGRNAGSGLKRAASMILFSPTKSARKQQNDENDE